MVKRLPDLKVRKFRASWQDSLPAIIAFLLIAALGLLSALKGFSQQTTFQKIIGTYAYDAHKVVKGNGYVFGGISSKLWPPNQRNSYVVRTDVNCDTLWTSCWGGTIGSCDQQYINDLSPLSDGGVLANGGKGVCGDTTKGGTIARLDANGNVKWAKSFSRNCDPYPCLQSSDGNFISGGYISAAGTGFNGPKDAYMSKIDSATGDTIWSRSYGGAGNTNWFYHILQTSDGGYLAAGETNSFGQGGLDIYLVKTDANGNLMWSKTYGTAAFSESAFGHCLQATSDGGYILAGSSGATQGIFLMKVDAGGNMSWAKYYDGSYAHAVRQTPDGGYILTGEGKGYAVLIKTDGSGNVHWSKSYGAGQEQGLILELASDGGYIAGGTTKSWGQGLYIVKTDSVGHSGCNETSPVITSSVAPFIAATAATQVTKGPNTVSYPFLFGRGATITNLCSTVGVPEFPANTNAGPVIVYPNPGAGMFNLKGGLSFQYTVYTILGELVWSSKVATDLYQLDLRGYANGIYLLRGTDGHNVVEQKLIIEK